jgi:hypothetical protein
MQKRLKPENRKDPLSMTCIPWYYSYNTAYFWHELAYTLPHFLKLNSNICGNPLAFLFFWLAILSELYLGTHLPWSKINKNKIKSEHGSHIRIHTTYNSIMFTYNICKPDDKRCVNTDLPPFKLGGYKINNIEWATTPNTRITNLHAIYMILCKMREWFDG